MKGKFGKYGGQYAPETLMPALEQLESAYLEARADPEFQRELDYYLREYAGLEREVTVLDTGMRFEIWDRGRHREELQTIRLQGQQLADEVGDLGL